MRASVCQCFCKSIFLLVYKNTNVKSPVLLLPLKTVYTFFSNWIMLVLWLLPFKHRCEKPLVHFFFFSKPTADDQQDLSDCNPVGVTHQMPYECHLCSIASFSPLYFRRYLLKERRSVKGGRDEPFRPWKKDLVTGHVAEWTLHGFCSGFHRPAYFGETRK